MDYADELMSKASWVLIELSKYDSIMMDELAKKMGYKIYTAIDTDLKKLSHKKLAVISDEGVCPHCGKTIVGLKVKKGSRMVRITPAGKEIANALTEAAKVLNKTLETR